MDKSQHLEEIKSTAENCYNIGYKRGYEAAFRRGDMKKKIIIFMLKHDILRNIFLIVMSVPVSIFYGLKGFCEEFCGVWEDTFDSIKDNAEGVKRNYE